MSQKKGFDYIIVGAGSAGCVMANRLSEDPDVSVCLIEAGKKYNSLLIPMPAGVGGLIKDENPQNWGFWTTPQKHMEDRKLWWPRGRGWGGSSSINGMIYIRGHARDYDQWRQTGLTGWGFSDVLPYFRKSEAYEGGADPFHGGDGPLRVTESPLQDSVYDMFVNAGREAGYPVTKDFNGSQQEGFGPYQRTIHDGERWSASFAYLRPIVKERENLTVMSTALVSRVVFRGGKTHGVEIVAKKGAEAETIIADREVIVCAGAVQSPQILQLSGIGPADEIREHGVTCVVDSPNVGANLQDHLDVTVIHEMTQKASAYSKQAGFKKLAVGIKYLMSKSGPGADNFLQAGAFLKTREGLDRPDIQLHLVNAMMRDHGNYDYKKDGFTIHSCQLRPDSRGTVMIQSNDPFEHPAIDPNYLAAETDRVTMRESVKMMREIAGQNALSPIRGAEALPGASVQSDEEIDAFIRTYGETIYHPVGTVAMGIHDEAPLDGDLKVRGVDGLRVVDASVMPTLIGGNTNAPTIMIAEKIADTIRGIAPLPQEAPEIAA
ncbi:MAG: choline dehydrogenase [Hyphomonas sp.]|nr:choline dehydrogenase [Hyphomonas sp.]